MSVLAKSLKRAAAFGERSAFTSATPVQGGAGERLEPARRRPAVLLPGLLLAVCATILTGCPWRAPGVGAVAGLPGGELALPQNPQEQSLAAALESPSPEARIKGLHAWKDLPDAAIPDEVTNLRNDPDSRVRAAALSLVARSGHASAEDYLFAALADHDLRVRLAAVAALGELRTDGARSRLEALLGHESELMRAAAVASLASLPFEKAVLRAAGDSSWRVRLAVAKALSRFPGRAGAGIAASMLDDPSAPVQQQVVASIAAWPLEQAGPLLLEAMGQAVHVTRTSAAEQLARRWEPASQFPADGPPQDREQVLEQLRRQFRKEIGFLDQAALAGGANTEAEAVPDNMAQVEQLVETLSSATASPEARSLALSDLQGLGLGVLRPLEVLSIDRLKPLPDALYRQVLPPLSPIFAELDRMLSDDVAIRRRAAGRLAELAMKQSPGRLAVARLAEIASRESDALVWQSMLTAVADDGSEPAVRLAAIAIGHPAPEVRRRACEHLAAHPVAGNAALLIPALKDPDDTIAAAAAAALGRLEHLDDPGPLRQLLANRNEMVRLETAVALARLGDETGRAELERLSYSSDDLVRRRVATAMGEVPDGSFVPALIRLLDDRQGIRVAALASLRKVAGHDVTDPSAQSPRLTEHIELWKRWYAGQSARIQGP